jgi:type I restriction enzyme S subunit
MNNGRTTRRLGDVCTTIQDGAHESPKKQFDTPAEGRFLYITSKNIRTNYLDLEDVTYVERAFHDRIYPRCQPRVGDVLLTKDGANTGNVTLNTIDEPFSLLSSVCLIKTDPAALSSAFLCYYLQSPDGLKSITGQMTGAAIKRIILRDIKLATIPLPPLPEQHRIVGILDEAFEGISVAKDNAEKNLQNARAIFESHLQSVFSRRGKGWVEKRLGEMSRINYGYTESSSAEKVGPHFLRITDIQYNKVDWSSVPYCPIEASDYPKYKLADGDIVFARTGATTGKSYLVADPPEAVFASYLIRVQVNRTELLPPFVDLFFQTQAYWDSIRSGVSGSAQGGFNATKLGELVIPFPRSAEKQQSIVAKLDAISAETQRLASLYVRKLDSLEALKKSLMHQAFTGQL